MKKYILFALLALAPAAFAQVSTQGTDFYLAFGNSVNSGIGALDFQIRIVATETAIVTLTFNADNSTVSFPVNAGEVHTYNLDATQKTNVYSRITGTSNKSLRIQSTAPVSVYALNQHNRSTDATNVLPVGNLGTDYYQVSYKGVSSLSYTDGYTVIATENNTTVYEDGAPMATLSAGQVYSAYYLDVDATGRHITASAPIAYFVTNLCAMVPVGTNGCDCLYQQLVPVNAWGKKFLVPVTRRGKERVRVVASQDNTTITQTGGTIKTDGGGGAQNPPDEEEFTLDAGQYAEFEILLTQGGCWISADKPVAVTSYLIGINSAGLTVRNGDPSMAWVPPIEQAVTRAAIAPFAPTGTTRLDEHHVLIVTPTATKDQTTVAIGNAVATSLTGGTWTTGNGAGSGYSFYSLALTNASASYYLYNPYGLTVMGYGLGNYESYYYLAGAAARNLEASFYVNNIHYQDLGGESFCSGQTLAIRGALQYALSSTPGYLKWYIDGVEQTSAEDDWEWDVTLAPGIYSIEMVAIDLYGEPHTFSAGLTVTSEVTVNLINDKVGCIATEIPATFFSSLTNGTTFTWTNSNPAIGLAASGTGAQPAFTAAQVGSATITVTPHNSGCTEIPRTYTIKVSPCVLPVNPHLMIRYKE